MEQKHSEKNQIPVLLLETLPDVTPQASPSQSLHLCEPSDKFPLSWSGLGFLSLKVKCGKGYASPDDPEMYMRAKFNTMYH